MCVLPHEVISDMYLMKSKALTSVTQPLFDENIMVIEII